MSKNTTCTCATYFPIIINQGIIDHFIQQLVEQMNSSSCGYFYKPIIDQFSYVDIIYKKSHRLAIESGHHTNVLKERRFCKFCSDIDDDFHFVLMYREYSEIRVKYIKYY